MLKQPVFAMWGLHKGELSNHIITCMYFSLLSPVKQSISLSKEKKARQKSDYLTLKIELPVVAQIKAENLPNKTASHAFLFHFTPSHLYSATYPKGRYLTKR